MYHPVLSKEVCACGEKTVSQAIAIFQHTDLPIRKAQKLVTECDKNCCKTVLSKIFDMTYYGKFDYDEIERVLTLKEDKLSALVERLTTE